MTKNPCRNCENAYEYKGRHHAGYNEECYSCKKLIEHKKYLESKRIYSAGETIHTVYELLDQTFVMWHGKPVHIAMIESMQLKYVLDGLTKGAFRKAVRRAADD